MRVVTVTLVVLGILGCQGPEASSPAPSPGGKQDIVAPGATCLFGSTYFEAMDQGRVKETQSKTYWNADGLLADGPNSAEVRLLGEQMVAAAVASTGEEFHAVADVFAASEASEVTVIELSAQGGRTFRAIRFYPGGNPYGVIFRTGTVEAVAVFGDDDITTCSEPLP